MSIVARISEALITQENNADPVVALPENLIGITIRCTQDSLTNVFVGFNENASSKNSLSPGQSISYGGIQGIYLDGNKLQIQFDAQFSAVGGRCLISYLIDSGEDC